MIQFGSPDRMKTGLRPGTPPRPRLKRVFRSIRNESEQQRPIFRATQSLTLTAPPVRIALIERLKGSHVRAKRTQSHGANELKLAARTNSKSRRERTRSRGANELKVAARTNSKSGRERTQSQGANELKVAARTNSQPSQSPMSPSLPNKVDRSCRRLGRDPIPLNEP